MTERSGPLLRFPQPRYPIRILGDKDPHLERFVRATLDQLAPGWHRQSLGIRHSRGGGYQSIAVSIHATGESQLRQLHRALMASPKVRLVL